jgi:hypothetical protein
MIIRDMSVMKEVYSSKKEKKIVFRNRPKLLIRIFKVYIIWLHLITLFVPPPAVSLGFGQGCQDGVDIWVSQFPDNEVLKPLVCTPANTWRVAANPRPFQWSYNVSFNVFHCRSLFLTYHCHVSHLSSRYSIFLLCTSESAIRLRS